MPRPIGHEQVAFGSVLHVGQRQALGCIAIEDPTAGTGNHGMEGPGQCVDESRLEQLTDNGQ